MINPMQNSCRVPNISSRRMLTKMLLFGKTPSCKTIMTAATFLTASVILFRSIASDIVPKQLQEFFSSRFQKLSNAFPHSWIVVVEESECLTANHMFDAVNVYLGTKVNAWTQRIKVNKPDKDHEELAVTVDRKDYYRRVGKAWKRGYLLYGPPGTGKSSLVAAMANYLKFDVCDLDLREVHLNSDLRRLLIGSANRSILVIEDIDCNVGLQNRENENETTEDEKITLSGLLNFIDGLWSGVGDEQIIVLTTNHKDRLDPALLRPGRMDVHIEMSYCTFSGFRVLASNYLKTKEHRLFEPIEDLFQRVKVTPAEVAGELIKSNNSDIALESLVKFFKTVENSRRKVEMKKPSASPRFLTKDRKIQLKKRKL